MRMLSTPQVLDIVATLISVFPQSQLWFNGPEFVLIGRRADAFATVVASVY